ncbi:hypothetical protein WME77_23265 [Sorangium sp. So ce764]|uniref:hypothetical protein n=1 Tax=Sorangium sp. So ce764 TaxID=3133320 RepID=UPI003F5E33F9
MGASRRAARSRQAAGLISLALFSLSSQVHAEGPPPRSPELLALFRAADEAMAQFDVGGARAIWGQIHLLEPTNPALCQLGQLDRRLERWVTAAGELSKCIERMPAPQDARERGLHEARHADFAAARQHVGELELSPPPGAERVLIAGKDVDVRHKVYVPPGEHEITAMGPQGLFARARVKIESGETLRLPLTYEVAPPAPAPEPAPAPKAPPRPDRATPQPSVALRSAKPPPTPGPPPPRAGQAGPSPWIVGTGAFVAASLVGTGIGLHVAASDASQEATRLRGEIKDSEQDAIQTGLADAYEQAIDVHERANRLHTWSFNVLMAGAVVGAATVVYLSLPRNAEIRAHAGGASVRVVW